MRAEELIGQTIGHYHILRPLGYGGTATVFLAQDIHLQREVAVKVFEPGDGDARAFLRRFSREARVLAQLDHPNILPVYDYGEQGDVAYLVMPYMAGGSLKDFLHKRGALPPPEAVKLIAQILHALQYAHDRKLIHRDIKPGNMLFKTDGTLILSDFGLVKVLQADEQKLLVNDSGNASQHMIMGTPDYMAPEQISGQAVMSSDIYSVGVVLYEVLTGQSLFTAENRLGIFMKQLYEQPRPLRSINPQISPALEAVVMRTLAKDPAARYQTPNELLHALTQAVSSTDAIHQPPSTATFTMTMPTSRSGEPPAPSTHQTPPQLRVDNPDYGTEVVQRENSAPFTPARGQWQRTQEAGPHIVPASQWQGNVSSQLPLTPQNPPQPPSRRSPIPIILALILITLLLIGTVSGVLYVEGVFGPHVVGKPTPATTPGANTATVTSQPVAQFTLTCPGTGTAHRAYTPNRTIGSNQNVIYLANAGTPDTPVSSTIMRRDVIANASASVIRNMPDSYVSQAQVSQDGLYVLFVASVSKLSEIRMIGTDGTYLQTLYCAPAGENISSMQWSYDQKYIIFSVGPDNPAIYLLQPASGQLQTELTSQTNTVYQPRTWLTNTLVYLVTMQPNSDAPPENIYVLDVTKGANQHDGDIKEIVTGSLLCIDFDASYKGDKLIMSACTGAIPPSSPSTITSRVGKDGTGTQTIYSSSTMAIVMVRSVTPTLLLMLVENSTNGNTDQNGLWEVNLDGTGLKQLTGGIAGTLSLCQSSQASWSNVSHDHTMYALQAIDGTTNTSTLFYGFLSGGKPFQIASANDGTQLSFIGWATL